MVVLFKKNQTNIVLFPKTNAFFSTDKQQLTKKISTCRHFVDAYF